MNNRGKFLSILILLIAVSCTQSRYKTIDYQSFEITVPKKWQKHEMTGTDSYVGGLITDKKDTLTFDIGRYSLDLSKSKQALVYDKKEYSQLSEEEKEKLKDTKHLIIENHETVKYDAASYAKYKSVVDNIDCFKVNFIIPTNNGYGMSGIYINNLDKVDSSYPATNMSFYGTDLSEKTQSKFFKALKKMKLKKYCK